MSRKKEETFNAEDIFNAEFNAEFRREVLKNYEGGVKNIILDPIEISEEEAEATIAYFDNDKNDDKDNNKEKVDNKS